jgi:hypothetical protein
LTIYNFLIEAENIEWDETDDEFEPENDDEAPESTLPTSLKFILRIENDEEPDEELIGEHVTDWLSDEFGFCHYGCSCESKLLTDGELEKLLAEDDTTEDQAEAA